MRPGKRQQVVCEHQQVSEIPVVARVQTVEGRVIGLGLHLKRALRNVPRFA